MLVIKYFNLININVDSYMKNIEISLKIPILLNMS